MLRELRFDGFEIIFQATLRDGGLIGHADFLRKVSRPSEHGDWSYEVMDTKLARSTKAKFIIQLGFYSDIVGKLRGLRRFKCKPPSTVKPVMTAWAAGKATTYCMAMSAARPRAP